jgi:hypothetical protein
MYDETGTEFTALDRAERDSVSYKFLKKHGAKHFEQLKLDGDTFTAEPC